MDFNSRGVIGDIIHYFTLMSSKLTLFAIFFIFSVTRRSRSDSRPLLSVSTDLTDVTLVSDDTY